jgi:hypothetical protein
VTLKLDSFLLIELGTRSNLLVERKSLSSVIDPFELRNFRFSEVIDAAISYTC